MSLLTQEMEDCTFLIKTKINDGLGGYLDTYVDGVNFKAAVILSDSVEARIAEQQGVTSLYSVLTGREITLEYHDVFRRNRDGKIFRVTSDGDDKATPKSSSLNLRKVTAEKWRLPNG